ncbi:hypothetical protein [Mesobacillus thioparans]|uniref:hypothetical protein n=1 Tax=Mesobacillus thioparans TaxID=370439 RepID=UPI0039EFE3E8
MLPILLDKNQQYRHHAILPAGIKLIIPDIDVEETDEIPGWLSDDMNDENGADEGEAAGTWNPEEEQF